MIGTNTILAMDLFRSEFENSLIFHIPHSQTEIPKQFKSDFVDKEIVEKEIELLTDFATDQIFNIEGMTKIVFPYSRVFCDVERLNDEKEVMFKYGRGFFYTKTDDGKVLRNELKNKDIVRENYYLKHHDLLTNTVDQKLKDIGLAIVIDCHSFSDVPFVSDIEQDSDRPDFCLGTDDFHTPEWLTDMVYLHLTKLGYSVELNNPYKGTIVPMKYYKKNSDVHSIMIEVNRKLYMREGVVVEDEIKELNKMFSDLFVD
ncbi:MAG TPA: N-formylglutamate amidohydrolase [Flavobacteriaceae bacterium]|nr:N-formylglutamate amidohydrolase [Flavobacteriaceae bacterium]